MSGYTLKMIMDGVKSGEVMVLGEDGELVLDAAGATRPYMY